MFSHASMGPAGFGVWAGVFNTRWAGLYCYTMLCVLQDGAGGFGVWFPVD